MDCLTCSKTKYYLQTDSKTILHEFNNIFNTNIDNLSQEMLCIFYDCIYVEPICYLNKNIYTHTFTELESIYENNKDTISITEKMIEHFFIGYKTFQNITMIINDLEKANFSDELKNQLFRFPTYISILENCLSNLFRFIILLLDQTTIKDLSSQNKLGSLCDILNKHNFNLLTNDVNVDIRNSINHGNVICGANGISSIINFGSAN